jgi:hypothetical protein
MMDLEFSSVESKFSELPTATNAVASMDNVAKHAYLESVLQTTEISTTTKYTLPENDETLGVMLGRLPDLSYMLR